MKYLSTKNNHLVLLYMWVIAITVLCNNATAGNNQWSELLRVQGGIVGNIVIAPSDQNILYNSEGYRSNDAGVTWQKWIGSNCDIADITDISIDPINAEIIYIATASMGMYKSLDGGSLCLPINSGIGSMISESVVIDPNNSNILFSLIRNLTPTESIELYKSIDGGTSWINQIANLPVSFDISSFAIFPSDSKQIVIGGLDGSVYLSIDSGINWLPATTAPATAIIKIVVDPIKPVNMYAITDSAFYYSIDGGDNWVFSIIGTVTTSLSTIVIDPVNTSQLYVGTQSNGVFCSPDKGITWNACNTGLANLHIEEVSASTMNVTSSRIFVGTIGGGIYVSDNNGLSWVASNQGLVEAEVSDIVVDHNSSSTIYVATHNGIVKTSDAGIQWDLIANGLNSSIVNILKMDPIDSTVLYTTTISDQGSKLFKFNTTSQTNNWVPITVGVNFDYIADFTIDPNNSNKIFSANDSGFYVTPNSAQNWNSADPNGDIKDSPIQSVVIDANNSQIVYASATANDEFSGGVYRSVDGGSTWSESGTELRGKTPDKLLIDPTNGQVVYAIFEYFGIFRSEDSGATWFPINSGLGSAIVYDIAVDQNTATANVHIIYAATDKGVYYSKNEGTYWSLLNTGLPSNTHAKKLIVDPNDSNHLLLGTKGTVYTYSMSQVPNNAPLISVFQPSDPIYSGQQLSINAEDSQDDGFIESYQWTQTNGPAVDVISNSGSPILIFNTPNVDTQAFIEFTLVVKDNDAVASTEKVRLTINPKLSDTPPIAVATANKTSVISGDVVTLLANESTDDNLITNCLWSQVGAPAVTLSGDCNIGPVTFTAPDVTLSTTLTFQLTVTDGIGQSDSDLIEVTINPLNSKANSTSEEGGGASTFFLAVVLGICIFIRICRHSSARNKNSSLTSI